MLVARLGGILVGPRCITEWTRVVHELALATSLIDAAVGEARAHRGRSITGVRCRIGRLRQVDDQLLREAFDVTKVDTLASDAQLEVVYTPILLECLECGLRADLEAWRFDCPECRSTRIRLDGGDEMELASLDVEVEDED